MNKMEREKLMNIIVEQCKVYNFMNEIGLGKYGKGYLDGMIWILDKMGIIVTPHRQNGLMRKPIESVAIYFREEDYITLVSVGK